MSEVFSQWQGCLSPVTWLQFTHYPCQLTYQTLLTTSSPNLTNSLLPPLLAIEIYTVWNSLVLVVFFNYILLSGSERLVTVFLPCLNHWTLLWNFPEVFHLFLLFSSWLCSSLVTLLSLVCNSQWLWLCMTCF